MIEAQKNRAVTSVRSRNEMLIITSRVLNLFSRKINQIVYVLIEETMRLKI